MIYNDGVPMDENFRVKYCPRCRNQEIDFDSEFCQICGLSLYNVCMGDWNEDVPEHKNKSNARFCRICGRPTTYYQQDVLVPFKDYKEEQIPNLEEADTDYDRLIDMAAATGGVMPAEDILDFEELVDNESVPF